MGCVPDIGGGGGWRRRRARVAAIERLAGCRAVRLMILNVLVDGGRELWAKLGAQRINLGRHDGFDDAVPAEQPSAPPRRAWIGLCLLNIHFECRLLPSPSEEQPPRPHGRSSPRCHKSNLIAFSKASSSCALQSARKAQINAGRTVAIAKGPALF